MGPFVVPPRVVPRIYTYIKKMTKYPKSRIRFWVNAQCAHLITRKPLNVRMGKGKGAKVRLYSFFKGGSTLAAVSSLRQGLQKKLRRFVAIRLGRPIFILKPLKESRRAPWSQRHRTQPKFLREKAVEIKTLLDFIRKPALRFFFNRLFRFAWRKPRLKWRWRWPLLPKRSLKFKRKRVRWGLGVKKAALIWAGLASLANNLKKPGPRLPKKLKRRRVWRSTFGYKGGKVVQFFKFKKIKGAKKKIKVRGKLEDRKFVITFKKKVLKFALQKKAPAILAKAVLNVLIPTPLTPLAKKWDLTYAFLLKKIVRPLKIKKKLANPTIEVRSGNFLRKKFKKMGLEFFERVIRARSLKKNKKSNKVEKPTHLRSLVRGAILLEEFKVCVYAGLKTNLKGDKVIDMVMQPGSNNIREGEETRGVCLNYLADKGFDARLLPKLRPLILTSCAFTAELISA
jgi:hypothetical protein